MPTDLTQFTATSRQLDLDLIDFARNICTAKGISGIRDVIDARPAHASVATLPDADVYGYAFGVLAAIMPKLAGWAEQGLSRDA